MKPSHIHLRGTVVAAAVVIFTVSSHGAPQQPAPVPVVEQTAPEKKKGMFGKLKSAFSSKKKEKVPVTPPEEKIKAVAKVKAASASDSNPIARPPATRSVPQQVKAAPVVKAKPAQGSATPKIVAVEEPAPVKKGFFKKLFGKSPEAAPSEPKLANAKTVKPAPVKAVKPEIKLTQENAEDPPKKRGLFGFLRGRGSKSLDATGSSRIHDSASIVRPDDWKEHRIVEDDEIALYSFGPSQPQGPDDRLPRGTVVKVKKVMKGWALVEVHGGMSGYMDASVLRAAEMNDFADPPAPVAAVAAVGSLNLAPWAPAPPPPDLPDQPGTMDNSGALLLLPPLELEPKP